MARRTASVSRLQSGAVKWAGRVGFAGAKKALEKHPEITSPTKLAGWLKGQAHKRGVLSSAHAYGKKHR